MPSIEKKEKMLITGGMSFIGRAIAKHFTTKYDIVLHYNKNKDLAQKIKQQLDCEIIFCDFSNPSHIEIFLNQVKDIDILINNAALFINDNPSNIDYNNFYDHIMVNAYAPIQLMKLPQLKHVINLLDQFIEILPNNFTSYTLSKCMLKDYTKIAAKFRAPHTKINAIALGCINKKEEQGVQFENLIAQSALKKPVKIEDLLQLMDFLLNNNSMTGEIINLDSGLNLCK